MHYSEEDIKRITRASLIFRALEEIGSQEIQVLQGTAINKGKVKVKLKEVRNILEREFYKDMDDHTVIDMRRLKQLWKEEAELVKIGEDNFVKRQVDLPNGQKSLPVDASVKELLRKIREEKDELLKSDNQAYQAYFAILGFIEKIALEITKLDLDRVIELDLIFDEFLSGKIKFINE